jgi:hypothetical protein
MTEYRSLLGVPKEVHSGTQVSSLGAGEFRAVYPGSR